MVAFANTTRHNLLSFQFVHGILILVLGVQVLQEVRWGIQKQAKPRTSQTKTTVKACLHALCGLLHISEPLTMDAHLLAGNESHEDIVADCGGGNIRTWCVKLRVAKFLPVLKQENNIIHDT